MPVELPGEGLVTKGLADLGAEIESIEALLVSIGASRLAELGLAKLERAHTQDLEDVEAMLERGLVEPERALLLHEEIEPLLYRFPAVDAASFRRRVERALR